MGVNGVGQSAEENVPMNNTPPPNPVEFPISATGTIDLSRAP
jgi:hypothetical protein